MSEEKYKATIGLEIHAELKTKTKMFCFCKNDTEEKMPNVNICPICMGHPGTLPVLNNEAIKQVVRVGLAVGGKIADFTEWDRKNYFYPDIPKGYQITQYKFPIVTGGQINGVELTRIHLEEDTAKSSHEEGDFSLVDFNRSGVPLMELVTEPVIHDAKTASNFAKELQLILQYLGAGDANMEKGEMRVEANISVSANDKLGKKVEVKNLNSFKTVERAVEYEIERQIDIIKSGKEIVQETRGWDEGKQITFSQRAKEDSHDYRYFPDPDVPKVMISEIFDLEELRKGLSELPRQKRERYAKDFGIKKEDIELYISNKTFGDFFESVVKNLLGKNELIKLASNYICSDLSGLLKNADLKLPNMKSFAKIIEMVGENKISSRAAKDILSKIVQEGGDPEEIAKKEGLLQESNEEELKKVVEKIILDNPKVVADYKAGKENAIMSLVGQAMKVTKGGANPQIIKNLLLLMLK
ncbi:MAG: Asp-tRNA(Asn)/Glu-tRNA(Gln) amidotransferase subunit GatB [Minisyncoccia bacterium]